MSLSLLTVFSNPLNAIVVTLPNDQLVFSLYQVEQTIDQVQQVGSDVLEKSQQVFQVVTKALKPGIDAAIPFVQQAGHEAMKAASPIISEAAKKAQEAMQGSGITTKSVTNAAKVLLTLEDDEQMPDFNNLTRLELDNFPYTAWEYVTSLLDKSPQLETIIFEKGFRCCSCSNHYCEEDDDCYCDSLSPSDIPLDPFSCQAQVIEVHDFCTHKGSVSLTGHLLKNASVLKRLILYRHDDDDFDLKITQELLMLPRASKDCCIEM